MKKQISKADLRLQVSKLKKDYSPQDLVLKSEEVFSVLEITGAFQDAKNIFIYSSMPDEVSTLNFINKWKDRKQFYLPVVVGNDLVFRIVNNKTEYATSAYGIKEPLGEDFTQLDRADAVIVPALAFDRKMNRLGRGKGYYDRFLPLLKKTVKIGVCFDFQLFDHIPADDNDVKMDMIVSENELIW